MKRHRGRGRRSNGNAYSNPNRHFESAGLGVKIRGSAQQVLDKYQQYGRDALTSGDRVQAEAFFQYAEHYQRIVTLQNAARDKSRKEKEAQKLAQMEGNAKRSDDEGQNQDTSIDKNTEPMDMEKEKEEASSQPLSDSSEISDPSEDQAHKSKQTDADDSAVPEKKPRRLRARTTKPADAAIESGEMNTQTSEENHMVKGTEEANV